MNPVARFESFVERLMERTITRTGHDRLQLVEIAKRLARVMEADQVVGTFGVRVPNIFDVDLSPSDYDQFKPIRSSVTNELETYLARVARDRLFVLASSPIVRLHGSEHLRRGEIGVRAMMEDIGPVTNGRPLDEEPPAYQHTRAMPAVTTPSPTRPPLRHVAQVTASGVSFPLEASPVSIGRAGDNDISLDDRRVSRHHAELVLTTGRWVLRDIGSTNGTALNGRLITQSPLHDGDRLSFGGLEATFQE